MAASRPRPRPCFQDGTPVSGWNRELGRQSSSNVSQNTKNANSSCNVRAVAKSSAPRLMLIQSRGLVIGSQEEKAKPKKNRKIKKQSSQKDESGEYEPLYLPRPLTMVGDTPEDSSGHDEADWSMTDYSHSPLTPVVSETQDENMGDERYYYAHGVRAGDPSYGKYRHVEDRDQYDFDDGQRINSQTGEMEDEDDVDVTVTPTSSKNVYYVSNVDSRPKTLMALTLSSGLSSSITRTRPVQPEPVQPLREHNQSNNASQKLDPEMDTLVNNLIKSSGMHFCTVSQKAFNRKDNFKRHMKAHDNKNLKQCDQCEKKFQSNYGLKRHKRDSHSSTVRACTEENCSKTFKNITTLMEHVKREHRVAANFVCTECDKQFMRKHLLEGHMASAHGQHPKLKCEHCEVMFMYKHNLIQHQKKWCKGKCAGEKEFKCPWVHCTKTFKDKRCLDVHTTSIHNKVKFSCSACQKSFTYYSGLKRHLCKNDSTPGDFDIN